MQPQPSADQERDERRIKGTASYCAGMFGKWQTTEQARVIARQYFPTIEAPEPVVRMKADANGVHFYA